MTRRLVIAVLTLFLLVPPLHAQSGPAIVGIWKLNREKSHLPPVPAAWFDVRQYTLRSDGYLIGLLITSNARGYHYLQFTAKSDGRDYPEYTDDLLADTIAAGTSTIRTYSETRIDDYMTAWTDKVNGKVTGSGRKIVSRDRQMLTITVDGSSQVYVYDRQTSGQ